MRYIYCFFFVFYLAGNMQAQVRYNSDSLLRYSSGQQYMDFVLARPALLWDSTRVAFGEAQIYYQSQTSDFRTAQTERQNQIAAFEARGYNRIGSNVFVSGTFSVSKMWQDSLAYALKGLEDSGMPTYYFVPKAGKFERQTYQGMAHVGYEWQPDKWRTDVQMNYTHHWATRSIDPRMEYYNMRLILKPSLTYSHTAIQTTIQGIWGYATGQTNISYKHTPYTYGNAHPEYHHRINYGYGSISLPLDTAQLRQYDRYKGMALQGQADKGSWEILWHGQYLRQTNESTNDTRRMVDYYVKQRFTVDEYSVNLLGHSKSANPTTILAKWNKRTGRDFNANLRATNYLLDQWDAAFSITKTIHANTMLPKEFGVDAQLNHDQRKDGSTSHDMRRTWMDMGLPLALTYVLPKQDRIRWSIRPAYRISLAQELTIPSTQLNMFSLGIAYPEHYYYGTNAVSLQTRFEYLHKKTTKNYRLGWYADFGLTIPEDYNEEIYPGTFNYRGNNVALRLGMTFYL